MKRTAIQSFPNWVFLLALLAFFVCGPAAVNAQEKDQPAALEQAQKSFRLLREGKYLAAQLVLEELPESSPNRFLQELASLRSFNGDYRGALEAMDQSQALRHISKKKFDPESLSAFTAKDAIETIVQKSRDRQIVILNEAHHVARDRAFALQLASRLRKEGFTYFAAETFTPFVGGLKQAEYPVRMTGHYSKEPVFGCLIREAMNLGFTPVAYEQVGMPDQEDPINSREEAQCQNLIRKVFAKDPDARVFIYVGFSHARETVQKTEGDSELTWFATRLARETGLDPLTIDQTVQSERSQAENESAAWKYARDQSWLDKPVVLVGEGNDAYVGGAYHDAMDLQVFHPATQMTENGRPDWLEALPGRVPVKIPKSIVVETDPILVQAFLAEESESAIPFDQIVLKPGSERPGLILREGEFRIVVQDTTGEEIHRESIEVKK